MKLSQKRLLFVDDEPGIRKTLPIILRRYGFQVTVCSTLAEAFEAIDTRRFDFLLCDLNIERERDGYEIVRAMRAVNPDCITIVLTAYPDVETAVEGIHLSIDDYITKPTSADALVALLAEKLAARRPKGRILSVSRDQEKLRTWSLLLEAKGYEVTSLFGTENLKNWEKEHFDVALLGRSLSTAEKQRAIETAQQCCVAVISISDNPAEESSNDGADYCLAGDPDAVLKAVAEIIARKSDSEETPPRSASTSQIS